MDKAQARALYLASLYFPSTPWTDADRKRFKDASDKWDREYAHAREQEGVCTTCGARTIDGRCTNRGCV